MSWSFRQIKKINYAEPDLTDDYGTFDTFSINQNDCYIQFEADRIRCIGNNEKGQFGLNDKKNRIELTKAEWTRTNQ